MTTYRQPFRGEWPITQEYGVKTGTDPAGHTGIDYGCPIGTGILASTDGTVIYASWKEPGYGNCVFLRHQDGNITIYEHLSVISVKVGQKVVQSEIIGQSGNTGNSTGPHLHFEARDANNKPFDPKLLPLMTFTDTWENAGSHLKNASELGPAVEITAPAGAWGWSQDFSRRQTVFSYGTKLTFTGKTIERLGYQYCECYPEPVKFWVAVNDGVTQILDEARDG